MRRYSCVDLRLFLPQTGVGTGPSAAERRRGGSRSGRGGRLSLRRIRVVWAAPGQGRFSSQVTVTTNTRLEQVE